MSDTATKELIDAVQALMDFDPKLGASVSLLAGNARIKPEQVIGLAKTLGLVPTAPTPPRLELRHTTALAWQPIEPRVDLVEGVIPERAIVLLYGDPGTMKTYLALTLAAAVASGVAWLGRQTQSGSVLVIDEESGEERLRWRMREVLNGMGLSGQTPPVYHVSMAGFDPCSADDLAWLIETVKTTGVRLVIIDALADISLGRNENSVGEMQPVFHALRQVVEATGCSILLVHHSNKLGQYRGTTALLAAVDLAIEAKAAREGVITLRTEKNRDGGAFTLTLEAIFKPGEFSWKQSETATNAREAVLRHLTANGPATSEQIAGATGYAIGSIWNALTALMRAGKVERTETNGKVFYSLVTHYSQGT
jgi:hypothetical protein